METNFKKMFGAKDQSVFSLISEWFSKKILKSDQPVFPLKKVIRINNTVHWMIILALFLNVTVYGQGIIKGKILNTDGQPLNHICVDVVKDGQVVQTEHSDVNGNYIMRNMQDGDYNIVIYYRKTERNIPNIKVSKEDVVQIKIKLMDQRLVKQDEVALAD